MGRRTGGRQSLNSSVITVTNNSVLNDTNSASPEKEYSDLIKCFYPKTLEVDESENNNYNNNKLIGSNEPISAIKKRIESLLNDDETNPMFTMITGLSGTGKTFVVKQLAYQYKEKLSFFYLKATWLLSKKFGDLDSGIRLLFDEAMKKAPSMIFIDQIDVIAADKKSSSDAQRPINVLLDNIENLEINPAKILLLIEASDPSILDRHLTRHGFFGHQINFRLPRNEDRVDFLKNSMGSTYENEMGLDNICQLANWTPGYSYRDLKALKILAKTCCANKTAITIDSFKQALKEYKPEAIRVFVKPYKPLKWDNIAGGDNVKMVLQRLISRFMQQDHQSEEPNSKSYKGALLYGPPGCSKTMLARALATESGFNFIPIAGPDLVSKYVGDSEAALRRLYETAREIAPCIIFFDEIDAVASRRSSDGQNSVGDRFVGQLLTLLDGISPLNNVFTLAATNRPERVDVALLRDGRLDPQIYVPLPPEEDRLEIFKLHIQSLDNKIEGSLDEVAENLAKITSGLSGSDISKVCKIADELADENSGLISLAQFHKALIQAEVDREQIVSYGNVHREAVRKFETNTTKAVPVVEQEKRASQIVKLMRSLSLKRLK